MNQHGDYLVHKSFSSKVNVRTHTDTRGTNCSIWTTKIVSDEDELCTFWGNGMWL